MGGGSSRHSGDGTIETVVGELQGIPGSHVNETNHAWTMRVPVHADVTVEVVVPRNVFEWSVSVRDRDGVAWSDWIDYSGYERNEDPRELAETMRRDVVAFIERLRQAEELQIRTTRRWLVVKRPVAWWRHHGRWEQITLAENATSEE